MSDGRRKRIEDSAFNNGTSFNVAKRALGAKHAKGSRHAGVIAPEEGAQRIRSGPIAGTGKQKGGEKT